MSLPLPRLSDATLADGISPTAAGRERLVWVPTYDRARISTGIVHLGLGAFFRAHGAAYTEELLNQGALDGGIVGVSLQRPDQRDRLMPQDGLYTLIGRDGEISRAQIIGAVKNVLVAPENPATVIEQLAAAKTRVITLTITEKGYCHDPATGRLSETHTDIIHDLAHPQQPRSALGYLVASLAVRRARGLAPPTVITCDNLPHNGRLLARLVEDLARLRDPTLADWIARNVAFPSTMVDRIVPAATDDDLKLCKKLTGLRDAAPVVHEPFTQWVIEDRFVDGPRPRWEKAGAIIVNDVAPFEAMKLQMLNGAHSALAYLGYLGGHETIADCVTDPAYRGFVEHLWADEIIPVTTAPAGVDLADYAQQLLKRFANPAIRHRTWQIAMDGSQKLPQRLLTSIERRLARGLPIEGLALVVAGWLRYVQGTDERGQAIDVRDPYAARFADLARRFAEAPAAYVLAMLAITEVFPAALAADPRFRTAVVNAYQRLILRGARDAVAAHAPAAA